MQFQKSLLRVKLLKRYKRFLADVYSKEMDLTFTVHCPNSGSMRGIYEDDPEPTAWISPADNAQRQLPYTLEMIETSHGMVGVNTQNPNKIAAESIEGGQIEALLCYASLKREVPYDENSRIDILLTSPDKPVTYVEVKNVSMRVEGHLCFPDAVTSRGTKHLMGLMRMIDEGHRAVMLYIAQRSDCSTFSIAKDIDPLYAETLIKAIDHGVEVLAYGCHVTPKEIKLGHQLKVCL